MSDEAAATLDEVRLMRHMIGADSSNPGYRNYGAF